MWFLKALGGLVLGLIGLVVIAVMFDDDKSSAELEVRTKPDPLFGIATLVVKNIGKGPITIIDATINERPECKPDFTKDSKGPLNLKVGDSDYAVTNCEVVRTKIKTDKGTFEYTFSARR